MLAVACRGYHPQKTTPEEGGIQVEKNKTTIKKRTKVWRFLGWEESEDKDGWKDKKTEKEWCLQ